MATEAAKGKRRLEAIQRIESACSGLNGEQPLLLPTYSRHGLDVLLILQLETLATFLEHAIGDSVQSSEWTPPEGTVVSNSTLPDLIPVAGSQYDGMSNKVLVALIKERGLTKGSARNQSQLIEILTAADQAAVKATA